MGPKVKTLLYGIKQESTNWFDLLKTGLESRGWYRYLVDTCVFYRKESVSLTYIDDCVIVSHKQDKITSLIESLNNGPDNYELTDKGFISNYLRVNIKKIQMGYFNYHNRTWRRK